MSFRVGALRNLNAVAQGVGGFVFGGRGGDEDDGGVEPLLERISDGVRQEDRMSALEELRDVVADNRAAQLAVGSMAFPVLLAVLKEERDNTDMLRGALEVLINGLSSPIGVGGGEVVPGRINSELLSREPNSVATLLNLLEGDDFYVRYHTVQVLNLLLTNSPHRVQDEVLSTPQGVVRLMDMVQEREVIRNEALLLLINLTRSAEEIQKIAAFEGAFERVFAIITEEGSADGGIVVQDCIELLNNLLRANPSNQVLLRETVGLAPVAALVRHKKGDKEALSRQKAANLLCGLETVCLLLTRSSKGAGTRDANLVANQTGMQQNKILDSLLALAVDGSISSLAVRSQALHAIGELIAAHPANRETLGSSAVGAEPALTRVLRCGLRAANSKEWAAADHVLHAFCEGNPDGQSMLASTITPLPHAPGGRASEESQGASFGSLLARALLKSDGRQDLEASCRAARVLTHILQSNPGCKERVLRIPLEVPSSALTPPDLLLPRCVRHLSTASSTTIAPSYMPGGEGLLWLQPVLLRLLVTWLADCPPAVASFLGPPAHLPFLVELTANSGSPASVHVAGLAAVLLGACIVFNPSQPGGPDASTVLDVLHQRVGLTSFFHKWEDMRRSPLFVHSMGAPHTPKPLTRATAAAVAAGDGSRLQSPTDPATAAEWGEGGEAEIESLAVSFYDADFVAFVIQFEQKVRDDIVSLFAKPRGGGGGGGERGGRVGGGTEGGGERGGVCG